MPLPAGWTREALIEEALLGPWGVPSPLADTRTVDREGWRQRVTPSMRQGALNEVGHCVAEPEEIDGIIDRTFEEYRALGCRFRWAVTPDSRPADLADRLAARGFLRVDTRLMARDHSPLPLRLPEGARVERVDASTVDEFTDVLAQGWSMDSAALRPLHRLMIEAPAARYRLYLARLGTEAVGVASYSLPRRSAYQMGAVVLPAFRGRGLYHALVATRLADAAADGLALATTRAMETTSAPILEKLGFETLCRFPVFTSPPG